MRLEGRLNPKAEIRSRHGGTEGPKEETAFENEDEDEDENSRYVTLGLARKTLQNTENYFLFFQFFCL